MASSSGGRRSPIRIAVAFVAALTAVGVAGCSAGQITQTDTQLAAVNGDSAQVGELRVSDVKLAYPEDGYWPEGSDVPLVLHVANNGREADELTGVSGAISDEIEIVGGTDIHAREALAVGTESGADVDEGPTVTLTGIKKNLYPGMVVNLTLTFQEAGAVDVRVPIAAPDHPRTAAPESEEESGH